MLWTPCMRHIDAATVVCRVFQRTHCDMNFFKSPTRREELTIFTETDCSCANSLLIHLLALSVYGYYNQVDILDHSDGAS